MTPRDYKYKIAQLKFQIKEAKRDVARYRWLRDKAGNDIMRDLMKECRPEQWDKLVDEAMRAETVKRT